ncbi:MAG: DNA translocase FtsK [Candidatus Omnitrophica bacterium]|nr:DNA translocase FtsK [Candidatus Omnitrophota bacterium]MDD5352828.1 DNA translocase FtsK [Candidatus Omnitrophota bacterium]MDD5550427.1 DNA translocase FtsK [Candidatus Omnitrophota bacterium]
MAVIKNKYLEEVIGIIFLSLAFLVFLSLISYTPQDLQWYTSSPNVPARNLTNTFGVYLSGVLYFIFGHASYLIPFILFIFSMKWFKRMEVSIGVSRIIGLIVAFLSFSSFFAIFLAPTSTIRFHRGGMLGLIFSDFLINYFGIVGAYVIIISLGLLSLPLVVEISVIPLFTLIKQFTFFVSDLISSQVNKAELSRISPRPAEKIKSTAIKTEMPQPKPKFEEPLVKTDKKPIIPKIEIPGIAKPKIQIAKPDSASKEKISEKEPLRQIEDENYVLPTLDLLDSPPPLSMRQIKDDLQANANILADTLSDFGISVRVANVERGPVITRYELEPAPGVKIQKIVTLSDDISLALKATSVRIVAPIPGKSAVGVEVPNSHSSIVYLKEVLTSPDFQKNKSKLTLALGKDIAGKPVISDLGEMPHLLIAGTTGSGKTVCVNSIIISMLFNATPSEVKFLMVDPKMVELAPFNGLPHLLCPVVTDAKKVSSALNWVVGEMESRYQLLAKEGVRNIDNYNQKKQRLPYIVIIIDELADLMVVAQNQIEEAITRLAQLSRAVGIHLILATQRPSVDVITGVIKANFPARISFKVASKVDSRTVLDMNGADKLLGRGDMLFLKPGEEKLIRAQGSYLQDSEIERVIEFICKQAEPIYDEEILKGQEKSAIVGNFEKDELFDTAVKLILESQHASVSILQRRLRLGYTRAARLIDMMEEEGIVGPYRGSKPREIIVDKETYLKDNKKEETQ